MTASTDGLPVEKGLPAVGPRLVSAIAQAARQLEASAVLRSDRTARYGKLWREILQQSVKGSEGGVAPNLLKGDVASSAGITLSGRDWDLFETSVRSGIPLGSGH